MIEASISNFGGIATTVYNNEQNADSVKEESAIGTQTPGPDCLKYPGVELGFIAPIVYAAILWVQ